MSRQDVIRKEHSDWQFPDFEELIFAKKKNKYCVCVFVINEGDRIRAQLKRMKPLSSSIDVVVADGGSTDGSLGGGFLKKQGVRALLEKRGEGKLSAQMRMAFAWALDEGYEGVVVVDGNDKDSVEDIPNFVKLLDRGFDHIQGSRFVPGGKAINTPLSRELGLHFLHAPLISLASGKRHTDTTNGFRAYSARLLRDGDISVFRDIFQTYELHYFLAVESSRRQFKTIETPVIREYPKIEKIPTKISPIKGNLSILRILILTFLGFYRKDSSLRFFRDVLFSWSTLLVLLGILLITLSILVFFPGLSSPDTGSQWMQVVGTEPINDWHPPYMVWLWDFLYLLTHKFSAMLILQLTVFWSAIVLLSLSIWKMSKKKILSLAPYFMALIPQVYILTGTLWKDVQLASALLMASSILFYVIYVTRRRNLFIIFASAGLILYAAVLRYNALIAAIPLMFVIWHILRPHVSRFKKLMISTMSVVLVSVLGSLVASFAGVVASNPASAVMLDDIVNTAPTGSASGLTSNLDLAHALGNTQDKCINKGVRLNSYWLCTNGTDRYSVSTIGYNDLKKAWIKVIVSNPLRYMEYRTLAYTTFLFGADERQYLYANSFISGMKDGVVQFEPASNMRIETINLYTDSFARNSFSFTFRPWFWLLLSIALLAIIKYKRLTGSVVFLTRALLWSSILYIASYLPMVVATDYRYIYWSVIATTLATILLAVDLKNAVKEDRE